MRTKYASTAVILGVLVLGLAQPTQLSSTRAAQVPQGAVTAPPILSDQEKQVVAAFDRHVKDYLGQRQAVAKKLPKLSKEASPEQIEANRKSFIEALRTMRAGTQPGYIFTPEFTNLIRTTIQTEFAARDKVEIRQTILEADTKGVPLKINHPYPATKEFAQVPPTLLLKLPNLPKEVKYRFVGRHMLLVDTDNGLIVDFTLNALP